LTSWLLLAFLAVHPASADRCLEQLPGPARGTWVYKIQGRRLREKDPGAERLLSFARRQRLTELYLSVGAAPLEDPATPGLIRKLRSHGLRVEALVDSPKVAEYVEKIAAYNRTQPRCAQFVGVHYDHEPWIGKPASDLGWSEPLLERYREGARAARRAGLTFAADISGSKLAQLPSEQQREFSRVVSWLVLMIYEARVPRVHQRAQEIFRTASPESRFMLATQVADFGIVDRGFSSGGACTNQRTLRGLEQGFKNEPQYRGWASFSYNDYGSEKLCPPRSGCCEPL
jgi:hypothetical protein